MDMVGGSDMKALKRASPPPNEAGPKEGGEADHGAEWPRGSPKSIDHSGNRAMEGSGISVNAPPGVKIERVHGYLKRSKKNRHSAMERGSTQYPIRHSSSAAHTQKSGTSFIPRCMGESHS